MSQQALDASLQQLMNADPTFAEMYILKRQAQHARDKEREQMLLQQQKNIAAELAAALAAQGMNPYQFMNAGPAFMQPAPPARPAHTTPPPLDEESPRADEAQAHGLAMMNPIARHRFDGIIKLMGIKVRYTTASMSRDVHQWILARMGKDGRMIRQEWTAPSQDPGCSLRTWEAMIGEFLDEVARRDGNEIPKDTDQHHSVAGTGNEAAGSAGNT